MRILMLAAENAALPGGKVGGVGDVLRDVPGAVAALGHEVAVLIPGYGRAAQLPGATLCAEFTVAFGDGEESVALFDVGAAAGPGKGSKGSKGGKRSRVGKAAAGGRPALRQLLLDSPRFAACGVGRIYCDDGPGRPFATDAGKFALFCAAAAQALVSGELERPDVVHLHDWHAATFAVLARLDARFAALAKLPLAYSIHNLAMQGIRPLAGDPSSLAAWFPRLQPRAALIDPRYHDCYNPVRAAIRLCDQLHTVSPTYAREICEPGGTFGEGLQADLAAARDEGRLHGILNGCEYPGPATELLPYPALLALARDELLRWIADEPQVRSPHLQALRRIEGWLSAEPARPPRLLTLVTRLTEQKVGLLAVPQEDGRPALAHALDLLAGDERLLVLGNGQPDMEQLFSRLQAVDERLLFLCGYSEALSAQFYAGGDLFLMPSRFEPCGIAQMLAMRAGQPCLVNRTGGLADTVEDGRTGFVFAGDDDASRSRAMLQRLAQALTQLRRHPRKREAMRRAAAAARFPWDAVARQYLEELY
jgi:starch synthase